MASPFVLTAQLNLRAPKNTDAIIKDIRKKLKDIRVTLDVKTSPRAAKDLERTATAAKRTAVATKQAATGMKAFGMQAGLAAKRYAAFVASTAIFVGLISKISEGFRDAVAFQKEMVRLSQVTGKSLASLGGMEKTITRLSTTLGVASKDLVGVSRMLAQAGFTASQTRVALAALAKTDLAPTFDNLAKTGEGAIAILRQFGRGVGALEGQLGAINAVAKKFAVESGDIIAAVRRTGGVFKAAGGSLNEFIALFTSVRSTTRETAETIATGLRTIFTRIQRPETIEFLKGFNVQLSDMEGNFVGPYKAVQRLSAALSKMDPRSRAFAAIAEQLGGFRQIGKVIPLLMQFETAQKALNVAMNGGSSLAEDAVTAQQALAVQFQKVREEFDALIRKLVGSDSFRVMTTTVINLAKALISLVDALEPVLPMLMAMGAMKLGAGLMGFMGGVRGKRHGGRVSQFARGGLVPGSGSGDTVPSMLQPGEFVIKKSSVNKMGAGTLAAMNSNKMAGGTPKGGVKAPPKMTRPQGFQLVRDGLLQAGYSKKSALQMANKFKDNETLPNQGKVNAAIASGKQYLGAPSPDVQKNIDLPDKIFNIQGKFAGAYPTTGEKPGKSYALGTVFGKDKAKGKRAMAKRYGTTVETASAKFSAPSYKHAVVNSDVNASNVFSNAVDKKMPLIIDKAFTELKVKGPSAKNKIPMEELLSKSARQSMKGHVFEAWMRKGSGKGMADPDGPDGLMDFPSPSKELGALFKSDKGGITGVPTDAKINASNANVMSVWNKHLKTKTNSYKSLSTGVQEMASGGGVSDTIPALLTPGEFVMNAGSSRSIGYGNLSRMNNIGKYNKGGVVRMAGGGRPLSPTEAGAFGGSTTSPMTGATVKHSTAFGAKMKALGASTGIADKAMKTFARALSNGKTLQQALATSGKTAEAAMKREAVSMRNADHATRKLIQSLDAADAATKTSTVKTGLVTRAKERLMTAMSGAAASYKTARAGGAGRMGAGMGAMAMMAGGKADSKGGGKMFGSGGGGGGMMQMAMMASMIAPMFEEQRKEGEKVTAGYSEMAMQGTMFAMMMSQGIVMINSGLKSMGAGGIGKKLGGSLAIAGMIYAVGSQILKARKEELKSAIAAGDASRAREAAEVDAGGLAWSGDIGAWFESTFGSAGKGSENWKKDIGDEAASKASGVKAKKALKDNLKYEMQDSGREGPADMLEGMLKAMDISEEAAVSTGSLQSFNQGLKESKNTVKATVKASAVAMMKGGKTFEEVMKDPKMKAGMQRMAESMGHMTVESAKASPEFQRWIRSLKVADATMKEEEKNRQMASNAAVITAMRLRTLNTALHGLETKMKGLTAITQGTASSLASMTGRGTVAIGGAQKVGDMRTTSSKEFAAAARSGADALGPGGKAMAEELIKSQQAMQGLDSEIIRLANQPVFVGGEGSAVEIEKDMNARFAHLPDAIRKELVKKIKEMVIDRRQGGSAKDADVEKLIQEEETKYKKQIDILNKANASIHKGLTSFVKELDKMTKGAAILTKTEIGMIDTQEKQRDYMAKLEGKGGLSADQANQGTQARVNAQLKGTRMAGQGVGLGNVDATMDLFNNLGDAMDASRAAIQAEKDLRENMIKTGTENNAAIAASTERQAAASEELDRYRKATVELGKITTQRTAIERKLNELESIRASKADMQQEFAFASPQDRRKMQMAGRGANFLGRGGNVDQLRRGGFGKMIPQIVALLRKFKDKKVFAGGKDETGKQIFKTGQQILDEQTKRVTTQYGEKFEQGGKEGRGAKEKGLINDIRDLHKIEMEAKKSMLEDQRKAQDEIIAGLNKFVGDLRGLIGPGRGGPAPAPVRVGQKVRRGSPLAPTTGVTTGATGGRPWSGPRVRRRSRGEAEPTAADRVGFDPIAYNASVHPSRRSSITPRGFVGTHPNNPNMVRSRARAGGGGGGRIAPTPISGGGGVLQSQSPARGGLPRGAEGRPQKIINVQNNQANVKMKDTNELLEKQEKTIIQGTRLLLKSLSQLKVVTYRTGQVSEYWGKYIGGILKKSGLEFAYITVTPMAGRPLIVKSTERAGRLATFAEGGLVPGKGNTDSVRANLTPGEFVIKKKAVQRIGIGNLEAANNMTTGGGVGVGGGGGLLPNLGGLDDFMKLMSSFSTKIAEATEAVGKFTLTVNHAVSVGGSVNVTGAGAEVQQALAKELLGSVSSLVKAEVKNIVAKIEHHGGQGNHRLV